MTLRAALLLTACGAVLAGCDLAPAYAPPATIIPAAYKETVAPFTPAQPADYRPRGDWWVMYSDPTLNHLEAEVPPHNQDLVAAVANYDRARADAAIAESAVLPQIGAGAGLSANRQSLHRPLRPPNSNLPTYYEANSADITATYDADLFDRIRDQARAGREYAQASAADVQTVLLSLQAELASDYFALRGLDAETKLLDDTVTAYRQALELTQDRFHGAIASAIDVSRAQTQLESARAQVADIASRRALLEHAIATLIGLPASNFILAPEIVDTRIPDTPVGIPSQLLEQRPDIASAERQVAAANQLIGSARGAFYPDISLNSVVGVAATSIDLFNLPDTFWTLGTALAAPLYEGGLLNAEEKRAEAIFHQAGANYRQTVLIAFQQVEDNLALLNWLRQEQQAEDAAVKAAQQTLNIALNLYKDGATDYLEVVVAQTEALDAERIALDLETRRLQASVGLIQAVGGGFDRRQLPTEEQAGQLQATLTKE